MTDRNASTGEGSQATPPERVGEGGTASLLADLRGADRAAEAPLQGPRARPRLSADSSLALLVLVVSAGAVYGMRQYGMRSGMTFEEVKIEYTPNPSVSGGAADPERILLALARGGVSVQVPKEEITKNPFLLGATTEVAQALRQESPSEAAARAAAELLRQQQEQRREEIAAELESLEVHGVMGGRVPVARIGDRTARIGDPVGRFFTVLAIEGRSVTLRADGQAYTLTMGEPRAPKNPRERDFPFKDDPWPPR